MRRRLVSLQRDWLRVLERAAQQARELGHLDERDDPVQLAFELQSLALGAHWAYQLFDDASALTRGLRAVAERLRVNHEQATERWSEDVRG